jgi:hypothetical protein
MSDEHENYTSGVTSASAESTDRYTTLKSVFRHAVEQASHGKGAERHDPNADRFEDQQIVQIGEWLGSNHFALGQAVKKAVESARMPPDRARAELLGAINYLAAAVITLARSECRADHALADKDGAR